MSNTPIIRYKLTTLNNTTYKDCRWGRNVSHSGTGKGPLCSAGWIHVYTHPLLAVLLNPIHGNFLTPHLWICHVEGAHRTDDGLKEGWEHCTTIKRMTVPRFTMKKQVKFAILCAKAVYFEPQWVLWANNWLARIDITATTARATADATRPVYAPAPASYYAAAYAAHAAAYYNAAVYAADAARVATYYAATARATNAIDLIHLAIEAYGSDPLDIDADKE